MLIQCSHTWTSDIYFVILQLPENLKIEIEILENLLSICHDMMDELGEPNLDDRWSSLLLFINIILCDWSNRNFVCWDEDASCIFLFLWQKKHQLGCKAGSGVQGYTERYRLFSFNFVLLWPQKGETRIVWNGRLTELSRIGERREGVEPNVSFKRTAF